MKVLTFYNAKGGVGKTTSALSVAATLCYDHKAKVCAVDLDVTQNSLSSIFLPDYKDCAYSVIDVMMGLVPVEEVIQPSPTMRDAAKGKSCPDLYVLPCLPGVNEASLSIESFPDREHALTKALTGLDCDYVVIDCPPSMNALTKNAIVASNGVIVPYKNDKYAYQGISVMLRESAKIKNQYNPDLQFLGVFFTHDKPTKVNTELKAQLSEDLGERFLQTSIRETTLVPESTFNDLPVVLYKYWSPVAFDYRNLTKEIMERL